MTTPTTVVTWVGSGATTIKVARPVIERLNVIKILSRSMNDNDNQHLEFCQEVKMLILTVSSS